MHRLHDEDFDNLMRKVFLLLASKCDDNSINECCRLIQGLDMPKVSKKNRIILLDTAIKLGNLKLVMTIGDQLSRYELDDDVCVPSKDHYEHPYRPSFWLAAVTTRQPYAKKGAYEAIEDYLCKKFNIPERVSINNKLVSRHQYIMSIEKWKHEKNIEFLGKGYKKPRYRRHEFLSETEKGVPLKPTKK